GGPPRPRQVPRRGDEERRRGRGAPRSDHPRAALADRTIAPCSARRGRPRPARPRSADVVHAQPALAVGASLAPLADGAGRAVRAPAVDVRLVRVLHGVGAGGRRPGALAPDARPALAVGARRARLADGARIAVGPSAVDVRLAPVLLAV